MAVAPALTNIVASSRKQAKQTSASSSWEEDARHYDEQGLAVLILMIATANLFNRLHVTIRQVAGSQSW